MKFIPNRLLLLAAIAAMSTPAMAAVPAVAGDVFIAFYKYDTTVTTDENGNTTVSYQVDPDTYVLNIGQASVYRESTASGVALSAVPGSTLASSNINEDLKTAFGNGWADDGSVRWMVIGGVTSVEPTTSGDTSRTIYYSRGRSSYTTGDTTPNTTIAALSAGNRGFLSTAWSGFRNGTNTSISNNAYTNSVTTPNAAGAIIATSQTNSTEDFLPPAQLTLFGIGIDPRQILEAGQLPGASVEGALDVYRILNSATGADLTAAKSSGNAVVGAGQYIGTFTLSASGVISVVGAAPAAGNYFTFAAANSPNLAGGPNGDADFDGIINLTEYGLNTNLTGPDGSVGTFDGSLLSFNKRADAVTNGDLTYVIEESDDLGISDPWTPVAGTNSTTIISAALPAAQPKSFGRLRITSSAVAP